MNRVLTVLTIVSLTLVLSAASLAESSLPPPPNIRITTIPQLNNEEQVFICPTDSNVIIANWRDFRLGYRQIGIGRSIDGGQTWADSLIDDWLQVFGTDSQQSDPTMTVDASGNFYMSALDWDAFGFTNLSTIAFYKSTDKGISWTGPVLGVWSNDPNIFEDKQFITADRTGGTHDGNIYCSWTRFPNPDRIVFVRSTDGMATFEDTVVVGPIQTSTGCGGSEIDAGQFSIPVVSSNGDVHVFWQGFALDSGATCSGETMLKHVVSTDGGQTFTYEDHVLPVSGYTSADGGINTYSQPAADADISGGPFDGNIYISFTNEGPEDAGNTDVDFVRSTDNAVTWSERIPINDDLNSDFIDNFHPWLIVNQEGVIVVIFYDQRHDSPNYFLFDLFAAYSFDGGLSFSSNHRISEVSSSPSNLKAQDTQEPYTVDKNGIVVPLRMAGRAGLIGEYIGVTAYYDKLNAVWTDSRDGNSEIYTANWYLPILEPRLLTPENGLVAQDISSFSWATAWKHDQDHYRIELAKDSQFTVDVVTQEVDTPFVSIPGLGEGAWHWRVKALNSDNSDSSAYSVTRSFRLDQTPPATPILLAPADGKETLNSTPTFEYSLGGIEPGATYELHISTDNTFPEGPETNSYIVTDTFFTPPDPLMANDTSYWKVTAADLANNGSESEVRSIIYYDIECGNIDGLTGPAGPVDVADLSFLVDYLFRGGPTPPTIVAANVDGITGPGGPIDVADLSYLVDFLFRGGPPPVCE